jgi:glycosyltransferase involved in cell wall biosynthesis
MRRRILICAFACLADPGTKFFGGGDQMAWNLVKRLSRAHRLWVLTAAQNRQALEAALEKEPLPGLEFVYVDLPGWLHGLTKHQGGIQFYAYLWQWKAYFVARKLHRQVRFDAFHHLSYDNDWMASPIGALLPVPYFRGPCGGAHSIPRAFLREFPFANRLGEQGREQLQRLFRLDPFFILSRRRAKTILVGNREAWEALPRRSRQKAKLMSVNGVPPELMALARPRLAQPVTRGEGQDYTVQGEASEHTVQGETSDHTVQGQPADRRRLPFHVLMAGRLVRIKGFDLAIHAFARFARSHPDAQFTIVGEGPELARLQDLTRALDCERQVRFAGWMPREQLFVKMASCYVFLFPSLRDGGGLVVVEAMAAGTPVICLDLGGPGLHVTDQCGIKVAPASPPQAITGMADALERLYNYEGLRVQMGQAARRRVEQVYDWDRVAERVLEMYRAALGA